MTRILLPLLFVALAWPAAAQNAPHRFPVDKPYSAISISGFDVQKMGLTMTVSRDPKGDGLRGSGHAGCNGWSAGVILREDQIDFAEIATTRKFCGKPRMKAEDAFLTSLKSAGRWRVDGDKLIIEGDAARLLLKAATQGKR
jgi:hypothetical protein